jgi:hypothetical protein
MRNTRILDWTGFQNASLNTNLGNYFKVKCPLIKAASCNDLNLLHRERHLWSLEIKMIL